jgi:hypothetical protein
MNAIEIAIGLGCLILTLFPGILVGGMLPAKWSDFAACFVAVAVVAKVTTLFH